MIPLILPGVTAIVNNTFDVANINDIISTDLNLLWLNALDECMSSSSADFDNYKNGGVGCNSFINDIANRYNCMINDEQETYLSCLEKANIPFKPAQFYSNYDVIVECVHYAYALMLMYMCRLTAINPDIKLHDINCTYVERLESYAVVLYLFRSPQERMAHGLSPH